jgi:hypothetical protein
LNIENPMENTVTYMASAPQDSGLSTLVPPIERHHQSIERGSTSQELWGSIISYRRSSQYGPVLAVFLVAIIILMQASIMAFGCTHLIMGNAPFFLAESCFLTLYFIAGNNHSCTH